MLNIFIRPFFSLIHSSLKSLVVFERANEINTHMINEAFCSEAVELMKRSMHHTIFMIYLFLKFISEIPPITFYRKQVCWCKIELNRHQELPSSNKIPRIIPEKGSTYSPITTSSDLRLQLSLNKIRQGRFVVELLNHIIVGKHSAYPAFFPSPLPSFNLTTLHEHKNLFAPKNKTSLFMAENSRRKARNLSKYLDFQHNQNGCKY